MSGLEFLLICRRRGRANICFIFHSFVMVQQRHTSSYSLGKWRQEQEEKPRHHLSFLRKGQFSVRRFLKIIPSTWSFPVMGSWAGLPGTVIIIASTETEIVNKMLQYFHYIYYDWGLYSVVWRNVECDVCCYDLRERKQMVQSAYVGTSRNGWCC